MIAGAACIGCTGAVGTIDVGTVVAVVGKGTCGKIDGVVEEPCGTDTLGTEFVSKFVFAVWVIVGVMVDVAGVAVLIDDIGGTKRVLWLVVFISDGVFSAVLLRTGVVFFVLFIFAVGTVGIFTPIVG